MNVYCKNCKWCNYREFASLGVNWGWFCKFKVKYSTNSIGHISYKIPNCETLNLDFSCPNYQRKWWKFWVK